MAPLAPLAPLRNIAEKVGKIAFRGRGWLDRGKSRLGGGCSSGTLSIRNVSSALSPMKLTHLLFAFLSIALSASAVAADASRPNILFIIFDDWNGSTHAGAYGCDWI